VPLKNGHYLVESVALCWSCHTPGNESTGEPRYAGSTGLTEPSDPGYTWSAPNITNDPETGRLGRMTEDQFVARFRAGRAIPHSPMPWQGYSRMEEDDLRAIYRYLMTVPPAKNEVGAPRVPKKG